MKVVQHDGSMETQVLIGMCLSKKVLAPIATRWTDLEFSSPWATLVADWCVEHYRQYGKAPGRSIETYFLNWAEDGKVDNATRGMVERFLEQVEPEYERNGSAPPPQYLLDRAQDCFRKAGLDTLSDGIRRHIERGELDKANDLVTKFRAPSIGGTAVFSPLADRNAAQSAIERTHQVIIKYKQEAMDNFFETALERDGFVGFMGKSKVGKSFWLLDIAMRAVRQKRRTYYVQAGDMSRDQVLRRIYSRMLGRPIKADSLVRYPTSITAVHGVTKTTTTEKNYPEPVCWSNDVVASIFVKNDNKKLASFFRMSVHSNRSVTINDIRNNLREFRERDGWVADVVVIDYMDILAPLDRRWETRDVINENWMLARSISQDLHCLVVVGTQSDTGSFNKEILTRENFTGARQVLDHVTGMVGINQTDTEKENQIYRLNWIVARDVDFPENTCVHTAACLAVANPVVCSTF